MDPNLSIYWIPESENLNDKNPHTEIPNDKNPSTKISNHKNTKFGISLNGTKKKQIFTFDKQ